MIFIGNFSILAISDPNNADIVVDDDYNNSTPGWGITHFNKIQNGINAAPVNGTIFVFNGIYYENIDISKSIILTGENKDSTIIDGAGNGNVVSISANYVNIEGFTIQNSGEIDTYGLIVVNTSNNNIINNTIKNNFYGIDFQENCNDNLIYHNNFINNIFNAFDYSDCQNEWDDGSEGNFWDDYIGTDEDNNGIGDGAYHIFGPSSCKDDYPLMYPWPTSRKTLFVNDDNIGGPWDGTQQHPYKHIQDAINNSLTGDTIYVYSGSYNENLFIDKAIDLEGENKNITVINGGGNGDVVEIYAYNLKVSGFKIQNSGGYNTRGLIVWDTGYNEITDNIFTDNYMGINLKGNSFENIIHHNYFINNIYNAFDYTECENQWDNGYPSGGNFWDDYTGSDTNGDRIGDISYILQGPESCQDRYPLITQPEPNNPPNTPFNPTPPNGAISININQDLYWNGGDPDGDLVTYDIYFGTDSTPIKIVSNQSTTSYDPGTMNYNIKYYWRIVAWDNSSESSTGPIWSFTTGVQSQGGNGGGGGGGGPILLPNIIPIADASASDSSGFINTPITFNASYSVDEDGEITNYIWDFGDGSSGYGIITTHIYVKAGVYNVNLTVTDNNDVSDTDSFKVIIGLPSNLPTVPQIDGPKAGKQNIEYNFSVFSTDSDNDNIQYFFNWGDSKTDETDFLANGTTYVQKHKWITAGIFKIRVFAVDSKYAVSDSVYFDILIDVIYCGNLGYLIDENSDGTYDLFYSNKTGIKTATQKQDTGSYLLNYDEDSNWDYTYDIRNNNYSSYLEPSGEIGIEIYTWLFVLFIAVILFAVIVAIIKRRKPKELIEKQKAEEPLVEEPKVEKEKIEEPKIEVLRPVELGLVQPEAVVSKVEEPLVEEPKTIEQKVEELITKMPKVEEPKTEEEKIEEAKTEETRVEKPEVEEGEQKKEEPKSEVEIKEPEVMESEPKESKVEEKETEEIEIKGPEVKESEPEGPKTEEQKDEEQMIEESKIEETKTEEPEVKESEELKVEEKETEEQKIEEQKTEEPEVKEPEESKTEESKAEEPQIDEPKTEEIETMEPEAKESEPGEQKTEEPKPEETEPKEPEVKESAPEEQKTEEPKIEESKVKEPKVEEPKPEEPKTKEEKTEEAKTKEPEVKKPKPNETEDEEQKT